MQANSYKLLKVSTVTAGLQLLAPLSEITKTSVIFDLLCEP